MQKVSILTSLALLSCFVFSGNEGLAQSFAPGEEFQECDSCPIMVVIPAGKFLMGSPGDDARKEETPPHDVTFTEPFAVGKFEVTFDEWDTCANEGGCAHSPEDAGWGRGKRPVMNVNWQDVQDYVNWLSAKADASYRLLTEAEWEYAARAGAATTYSWGDDMIANQAKCRTCDSPWQERQSVPVGSFPANAFGLHDMHGNVSEWVEDCWNGNYTGAPADGSAWTTGTCDERILRGGGWRSIPWVLRAAGRFKRVSDDRNDLSGFRVARSID